MWDTLVRAQGSLKLGMLQDACDELETLPPKDRAKFEVILLRLQTLQSMERWKMGAEIARGGIRKFHECGDLFILGAYAIRRAESIEAAFEFLESVRSCLEGEECFWFNRGCCHCLLNRLDESKEYIARAIRLDSKYQKPAVEDEHLKPLWDSRVV